MRTWIRRFLNFPNLVVPNLNALLNFTSISWWWMLKDRYTCTMEWSAVVNDWLWSMLSIAAVENRPFYSEWGDKPPLVQGIYSKLHLPTVLKCQVLGHTRCWDHGHEASLQGFLPAEYFGSCGKNKSIRVVWCFRQDRANIFFKSQKIISSSHVCFKPRDLCQKAVFQSSRVYIWDVCHELLKRPWSPRTRRALPAPRAAAASRRSAPPGWWWLSAGCTAPGATPPWRCARRGRSRRSSWCLWLCSRCQCRGGPEITREK